VVALRLYDSVSPTRFVLQAWSCTVIVRQWRAWAAPGLADQYEQHFREHVLPHLAEIDGFVRAQLLRRDTYGLVELIAQTYFESLDAVRAFAGESYERAVVAPEAEAVLARYDERCVHFEIAAESGTD
jgi:heme-degrading monooxygenase HmoA